jgi:hypothetical protein
MAATTTTSGTTTTTPTRLDSCRPELRKPAQLCGRAVYCKKPPKGCIGSRRRGCLDTLIATGSLQYGDDNAHICACACFVASYCTSYRFPCRTAGDTDDFSSSGTNGSADSSTHLGALCRSHLLPYISTDGNAYLVANILSHLLTDFSTNRDAHGLAHVLPHLLTDVSTNRDTGRLFLRRILQPKLFHPDARPRLRTLQRTPVRPCRE